MDPAVVIALIALAGSVVSTAATVWGAPALQARREAVRARPKLQHLLLDLVHKLDENRTRYPFELQRA